MNPKSNSTPTVTELQIIKELISFCKEIDLRLQKGDSLQSIRKWSFEERESGRNIPYLAMGDPSYLFAAPTREQRDLRHFFCIVGEGCRVVSKYVLEVGIIGQVQFRINYKVGKEIKKFYIYDHNGDHSDSIPPELLSN